MKASDLIESVDILKKIEAKQEEIAKTQAKQQEDLGVLIAKLPPALRSLIQDNGTSKQSRGTRVKIVDVQDKIKQLLSGGAKMTIKELMEQTGYTQPQVYGAIKKMDKIHSVESDKKKGKGKPELIYSLKK